MLSVARPSQAGGRKVKLSYECQARYEGPSTLEERESCVGRKSLLHQKASSSSFLLHNNAGTRAKGETRPPKAPQGCA